MVRLQLSVPGNDFLTEHLFNRVVTAHAFIIIFFMVMPILIGGFGNWFIPLLLGSLDVLTGTGEI